ncbi:MAG: GntR family transcriptional regulator [Intestinibacillus sp.]
MRQSKNAVLGERVYEYIKEMILRGDITSGEKIPEQKIVEQLNVSRTPVREAVRRLAGDGLIVFTPNKSAEIIRVDAKFKRDLGVVRFTTDCLSAILALQNGSNADFESLRELSGKCQEAQQEGDLWSRIRYDSAFHMRLVEISGNALLVEIQKNLYVKAQFAQTHTLLHKEGTDSCDVRQHEEIISALFARDPERVMSAIRQHLLPFYGIDDPGILNPYGVFRKGMD